MIMAVVQLDQYEDLILPLTVGQQSVVMNPCGFFFPFFYVCMLAVYFPTDLLCLSGDLYSLEQLTKQWEILYA